MAHDKNTIDNLVESLNKNEKENFLRNTLINFLVIAVENCEIV